MAGTIFPQSPNWFLTKIMSARQDGSVAYGTQNNLLILKHKINQVFPVILREAHSEKVTSVAFPPVPCYKRFQNTIMSSSEDGYVKLWSLEKLMPLMGHKSHWEQGKDSRPVKVVCAGWSYCNPQFIVSAAENDTIILWDVIDNSTTKFYFRRLKPTVLECSHHDEKLIACGSKNGLVYIIKLIKSGEIIHKFRGHDKEVQALSWSPMPSNESMSGQYYVASSSQERDIYIWHTVKGVCEAKIPLPKGTLSNAFDNAPLPQVKWDVPVNFTPIFWSEPFTLYAGTKYGELISCDVRNFMRIKSQNGDSNGRQTNVATSCGWKLIHAFHSKMVMAIAGVHGSEAVTDNDKAESVESRFGNKENLIWTIGKDQNLIAALGNPEIKCPVFNFHTLNGHATEAVASPHDPNKIAIAGGDGKIRLWNASRSSGCTRVYWHKINDRVQSLAWHPTREGLLAFGTSEGRIGLMEMFILKKPMHFKVNHHGIVYRMSWGPPFSGKGATSPSGKKDYHLYFVENNNMFVHDPANLNADPLNLSEVLDFQCRKFSDLCWKPDYSLLAVGCQNGSVYLLQPPELAVRQVIDGFKKYIRSLEWHPMSTTSDEDCSSFHGYFTFGSNDNDAVIKVYNCSSKDGGKVEQIAALKGHSGNVQAVAWNPHSCGRLVSISTDFTVRIWDVTKNTQLAKFVICQTALPLFCIWSSVDPDIIIAGIAERTVISWRISTERGKTPLIRDVKVKKEKCFELGELLHNWDPCAELGGRSARGEAHSSGREASSLPLARVNDTRKSAKDSKMFCQIWKTEEDPFKRCYNLLKGDENAANLMPLLGTENEFSDFLNSEAASYQDCHRWNEYHQMTLWQGRFNEVLEEKIKTGHVDEFLVSLAPSASPRLWREACISYARSLAEKKMYTKAACYLTAVHEVHEAIDLLVKADLYLEAICIARCRLPDTDPAYSNSVRKYAEWLVKTGSYLKASECYISLNEYEEAASVLAKKNHVDFLSLAAVASQKAGLEDREKMYALRSLLMCLESHNWELASRICQDHENLKHFSILYIIHREIIGIDAGIINLEKDLLIHLREAAGIKEDETIYAAMEYIYDRNSLYFDRKKLHVALARELVLACCSDDKGTILMHVIRAMNSASRYMINGCDDHTPLFKLCSWLCSNNYLSEGSIFCWEDTNIQPKMITLRAFLCQGIVEYVDNVYSRSNENALEALSDLELILMKLLDDALDKNAFIYFKHQLEVISIEKCICEAHQKKIGLFAKKRGESGSENDGGGTSESVQAGEERSSPGEADEDLDGWIALKKERLGKLKREIKDFEGSRFLAPNPALIYCILRRVSDASGDPESRLRKAVDKKWKEL